VLNSDGVAVGWPGWRPLQPSDFPLPPGATVYGTQIEDPSLPSSAYREPMTVTFDMGPFDTATVQYPDATPAGCVVARVPDLHIANTASVTAADGGVSFSYHINVTNTSTLGVADPVTMSDPIPSTLKVTGINTPDTGFPHWQDCAVTGTDPDGFGGTLACHLSAALGVTAATPPISLAVTVASTAGADSVTNTATTCWKNPSQPTDAQRCANSTAVVTPAALAPTTNPPTTDPPTTDAPTSNPPTVLANTGIAAAQMGWLALFLVLGGGLLVTTATVWQRKPRRTHRR
jgi:hypothetical protein